MIINKKKRFVKMKKGQHSESITNCDHELILDECRGDYICSKCGLVIERYYVISRYQMENTNDVPVSSSSRFVALGERPNMVDGLGSYIGFQYSSSFTDRYGNKLSPNKQILFKRLKYRYDLRSKIVKNETDYRILNILNRVINKLNLSNSIRDRAAYYYKKISKETNKEDITNHVVLIALCIFLSIREYNANAPITIQELAKTFKEFNYRVSARSIIREAIKVKPHFRDLINHKASKSENYIERVISGIMNSNIVIDRLLKNNIDLNEYSNYLKNKSRELLSSINLQERGGRNPYIFAVAIVYTAAQIKRKLDKKTILTQKILANITNCAEYSIRDHYKFIRLIIISKFQSIKTERCH